MGNGTGMGLIIGVVVCAIIAIAGYFITKKDKSRIDDYLSQMTDEEKNQVQNQTFASTDKKNMFTSNAFVVKADEVEGKIEAVLIFYMENHTAYYDRKVKVAATDPLAANLKKGNFVPVLMKWDKDMYYYDFKKLI